MVLKQLMPLSVHLKKPQLERGPFRQILQIGIDKSRWLTEASNLLQCDFAIIDAFRILQEEAINLINQLRLARIPVVACDYSDSNKTCHPPEWYDLYFKRSIIERKHGQSIGRTSYSFTIEHIPFCGRYDIQQTIAKCWTQPGRKASSGLDTDLVVSCFFEPNTDSLRGRIASYMHHEGRIILSAYGGTVRIGYQGNNGVIGRNEPQDAYIQALLQSAICVTANPDNWEGDWRFYEALQCGCFVLVDRMLAPPSECFKRGVHFDCYSSLEELGYLLHHYAENLTSICSNQARVERMNLISSTHMPRNRMEHITSRLIASNLL